MRYLIYGGPGVYEPHITPHGTEWRRNTDGDPLVGVEVTNIANVKKFAELVKVEPASDIYETEGV